MPLPKLNGYFMYAGAYYSPSEVAHMDITSSCEGRPDGFFVKLTLADKEVKTFSFASSDERFAFLAAYNTASIECFGKIKVGQCVAPYNDRTINRDDIRGYRVKDADPENPGYRLTVFYHNTNPETLTFPHEQGRDRFLTALSFDPDVKEFFGPPVLRTGQATGTGAFR